MITNFKYWVQNILPQVYNDSLSYQELLYKVVVKLNEVVDMSNLTKAEVDELYNFIHNSGLNAIINETLEEWYADGKLGEIINDILLQGINNQLADDEVYAREATGYGVISGLIVQAQENPDMSVMVTAGIAHTYAGKRYIQGQDQRIAISPANGTYARWDIVYISPIGQLMYLAGEPNAVPVKPVVEAGSVILGYVFVNSIVTIIIQGNVEVVDSKKYTLMELEDLFKDMRNDVNNNADTIELLDGLLDTEVLARQNADNTLQQNIDAEELARQQADTLLQQNVDAEELARQQADTALQDNIGAEELARQNADTVLQDNIDAEELARQQADTLLQQNVDAEELARQQADTTLGELITGEALARGNADDVLQDNIDELSLRLDEIEGKGEFVNVKDFGATGNGSTDDTVAIQNAINSITFGTVLIENGVFMVKGTDGTPTRDGDKGGVALKSNVNVCIRNATLKVINTNYTDYNIFRGLNIKNVRVYGESNGIIEGDRLTNNSPNGEHGFGIGLWNAKNVLIEDLTIKNCWGDSVILTNTSPWTDYCENVTIRRVICDNNRRQGISVTVAKNTVIEDCKFFNIYGTSPQCGIDVEPNMVGDILEDTRISNCYFRNNVGGVLLHGGKNTIVTNCSFRNNTSVGLSLNNNSGSLVVCNQFIDNPTGISAEVGTYNVIENNYIYGGGTGMSFSNASSNNDVKGNTLYNQSTVGMQFVGVTDNTVVGNTVRTTPKALDLYLANKTLIQGNKFYSPIAMVIVGDYNNAQGNYCTTYSTLACNLSGADNVFSNNDMLGGTLNDGGTDTIKVNNRI